MSRSSPALVALIRGRTTAGGDTLRSRMPTRVPIPTLTPADSASIHRRTGIAHAMIRKEKTRAKGTMYAKTSFMVEPRLL